MNHVMNNMNKINAMNKTSKTNKKIKTNKILSDYFNSMYLDCIKFTNDNKIDPTDNHCNFINEKINELKPKTTDKINHIIYAVTK